MSSLNDSVIICETKLSPKINPNGNLRRNPVRRADNRNKSNLMAIDLSQSGTYSREPLRTVYEIDSHNDQGNNQRGTKRFRGPETYGSARKRRRTINLCDPNDTIVISDDDDDSNDNKNINTNCSSTEQTTSKDVILLTTQESKNNKKNANFEMKKKSVQKRRRKLNNLRKNMLKCGSNTNVTNSDDVAVVWASSTNKVNSAQGTVTKDDKVNEQNKNNNNTNDEKLFFYDCEGDWSNFEKICFFPSENNNNGAKHPCRSVQYNKKRYENDTHEVTKDFSIDNINKNVSKDNRFRDMGEDTNIANSKHKKGKSKNTKNYQSCGKLREIVVDGSNIAFGYTRTKKFSEHGLRLVLNYFRSRGHDVKIFLPQHERCRSREFLEDWYRAGSVVFTPSRTIGGKKICSYDDRFILDYATKCDGIVISSDQYRDLWQEKPEWRKTIEKRLLIPTFVGNYVMFPEDPLGRSGPKLKEFLRH